MKRALLAALVAALLASPAAAVVLGGGAYVNVTGTSAVVAKSGQGVLHNICVNGPAAGTITIYDNTAGSGTKIGTITIGATLPAPTCIRYEANFKTGLTIVASVAMDITVVFN